MSIEKTAKFFEMHKIEDEKYYPKKRIRNPCKVFFKTLRRWIKQ